MDHEYTPRALAWTRLKGADAQRVPLLQWALDELTSMASVGDVAGARDAAATLEPFWAGLDHGHSTREDGTDSTAGLLGRALRAADTVEDSGVAAMLLKPFTITRLARDHAEPLGRITADYGPEWTDSLLHAVRN